MIKLDNVRVSGFEDAIRGMRNPMNSWAKSDSVFNIQSIPDSEHPGKTKLMGNDILGNEVEVTEELNQTGRWSSTQDREIISPALVIGPNDYDLMKRLAKAGPVDAKYRRMIIVYVDITAPLYWWKDFDTYKVGTVANSCSTMHKIHAKEFTLDDFSTEHLINDAPIPTRTYSSVDMMQATVENLNMMRQLFLETNDKKYWWQMIQLLPSSYNQKRTIMLNYEVLHGLYPHRRNHKLDEFRILCKWIETLPYSELILT